MLKKIAPSALIGMLAFTTVFSSFADVSPSLSSDGREGVKTPVITNEAEYAEWVRQNEMAGYSSAKSTQSSQSSSSANSKKKFSK